MTVHPSCSKLHFPSTSFSTTTREKSFSIVFLSNKLYLKTIDFQEQTCDLVILGTYAKGKKVYDKTIYIINSKSINLKHSLLLSKLKRTGLNSVIAAEIVF